MDKMTKKIIVAFALMICAAGLIIGGYYYISRNDEDTVQETKEPTTEVGKLLAKDLDTKYPETPTEVVKLYWRLNKCMYNTTMEDEDFEGLLKQIRKLYDDEFLAEEDNSWDNMLKKFSSDKASYKKSNQTISTYMVQPNSSTDYGELDGKECATVVASTILKKKGDRTQVYEKFLCRKNSSGDWKILGWQQTNDKDDEAAVSED